MANKPDKITLPSYIERQPSDGRSLRKLLGPPPIMKGEDASIYDEIEGRYSAAVQPRDVIEEMWVRDLTDLTWEVIRLRKLKAKFIDNNYQAGLNAILKRVVGIIRASALISGWATKEPAALKNVKEILNSSGFDDEAIKAETISAVLDNLERFDTMILRAESRRTSIIREIDRHRHALAIILREEAALISSHEPALIEGPVGVD